MNWKQCSILAGFYLIAAALTVDYWINSEAVRDLRKQKESLEKDLRDLANRSARLQREKDALENDPYYIEKTAREQMGWVGMGEIAPEVREAKLALANVPGQRGSGKLLVADTGHGADRVTALHNPPPARVTRVRLTPGRR